MNVSRPPFLAIILCTSSLLVSWATAQETSPERTSNPSFIAPSNEEGESLREAARLGDIARIDALLNAGVPVDSKGRHGMTPLMVAARNGKIEAVETLVKRGADLQHRETFFHQSALSAALSTKQLETAVVLLRLGAKDRGEALLWAVENGKVALAEEALRAPGVSALDLAVARKQCPRENEAMLRLLESATASEPTSFHTPPPDPKEFSRFAGSYRSDGISAKVRAIDDGLEVTIEDHSPVKMLLVADRRFENEARDLRLEFEGRTHLIEAVILTKTDGDQVTMVSATQPSAGELEILEQAVLAPAPRGVSRNWMQFRGPNASGIGDGQGVPLDWDLETGMNIRFKIPIPGIATSSPIICDGQIFLSTAVSSKGDSTFRIGLYGDGDSVDDTSEHSFRLISVDSQTGAIRWDREVATIAPTVKRHLKSSFANATPVTDGETVVALFGMVGLLAAYDRDGNERWKTNIGVLEVNDPQAGALEWGHASSPILWNDLVIVQADQRRNSFIAAFDKHTGKEVWRVAREEPSTWATPTIVSGPKGDELVSNGNLIRAYQPATGELLWSHGPNSEVIVATPLSIDGVTYVTGGYPPVRPVYAIRVGSRGNLRESVNEGTQSPIVWSHDKGGTYLPTPIAYQGHLITINNNGVLTSYRLENGEIAHRGRLAGASISVSASPIAVDGKLLIPCESGEIYILRGTPGYEILGKREMQEVLMATPAVSDGLLVIRTIGHLIGIAQPGP